MPDCMMPFPEDWHDFLKDYSFDDSQEVYTNGSRLIPVFRVEQLIKHLLKSQEPRVMTGAELTDAELIEKIRKAPIVLKPNVDAVTVVRCRDCMYFRPWRHDRGEDSRCEFWNAEIDAEDYCSQAIYLINKMDSERRDGE